MKLRKVLGITSLIGVAAIATPIALTSCSPTVVSGAKAKIVTKDNYSLAETIYTTLNTSNVSVEDAVYGSNFNNGNYLFIYGTTSDVNVRNLLYSPQGDSNQGNNNTSQEQSFKNSKFFKSFFTNSIIADHNVQILMFIDVVPYVENAGANISITGNETPFDTFTLQEILDQINGTFDKPTTGGDTNIQEPTYDEENMPLEAKFKVGSYKRNDKSAKQYRKFYNYISVIRQSLKDSAKNGGIIGFKKGKNPTSFPLSDTLASGNIADIENYYKTK